MSSSLRPDVLSLQKIQPYPISNHHPYKLISECQLKQEQETLDDGKPNELT
jgi:hypothetical protein